MAGKKLRDGKKENSNFFDFVSCNSVFFFSELEEEKKSELWDDCIHINCHSGSELFGIMIKHRIKI